MSYTKVNAKSLAMSDTTFTLSSATLLAYKYIAKRFSENIYELSRVRNNWNAEYAKDLSNRIDQALLKYFDETTATRKITVSEDLGELPSAAIRDLSLLRAEIKVDFHDNSEAMVKLLTTLGFDDFYCGVRSGNRECLLKLLCRVKNNLTDELKTQIVEGGVKASLIEKILNYAEELTKGEACKDLLKYTQTPLSEEAQKELDILHMEIKEICKITSNYYMFDPMKKDQFSISKVLRGMSS
ncbi:MAG: hypothetical protein Q8862_04485 [Bacteroidota bacterium]|nr:hypothetical protein [Bacteroidota bacterium]MDP4205280.1 hypothetical protein [Bacteroidota bacterium]